MKITEFNRLTRRILARGAKMEAAIKAYRLFRIGEDQLIPAMNRYMASIDPLRPFMRKCMDIRFAETVPDRLGTAYLSFIERNKKYLDLVAEFSESQLNMQSRRPRHADLGVNNN